MYIRAGSSARNSRVGESHFSKGIFDTNSARGVGKVQLHVELESEICYLI